MIIRRYAHRALRQNNASPTKLNACKLRHATHFYYTTLKAPFRNIVSLPGSMWDDIKEIAYPLYTLIALPVFAIIAVLTVPLWGLVRVWLYWPIIKDSPQNLSEEGEL